MTGRDVKRFVLNGKSTAVALGALMSAALAGPAIVDAARAGTPLAKLAVVGGGLEREIAGVWKAVPSGDLLRVGDRIRTSAVCTTWLDFAWTSVVLSPSSVMRVPAAAVLALELQSGRLEQSSKGADVIKVRAGDALVRGTGNVVIWRHARSTTVSVRLGRLRVQTPRGSVRLSGAAAIVPDGEAPALRALPAAPDDLVPGIDPVYVERDRPIDLTWSATSRASEYHVEVVAIGADDAVVHLESRAPAATVRVPWPGTFRWRVFTVDEEGVEGFPSRYGFFCVPGF